MKNRTIPTVDIISYGLINPEKLWAIENELINIPQQYRDRFWSEVLENYTPDLLSDK